MISFEDKVCIRGDNDAQSLSITSNGQIKLEKLLKDFTKVRSEDINVDELGDFWICDQDGNIKKFN